MGITFIQSDASIAGGQSGGALISEQGDLIGISGQSFTEAQFSLSASISDLRPYVTSIIAGRPTSGLGNRGVWPEGRIRHRIVLESGWELQGFQVIEPPGGQVEITLSGDTAAWARVYDSFSRVVTEIGEAYGALPSRSFESDGLPHYVVVGRYSSGPGDFSLQSNHRLIPIPDPDDGKRVEIGQTINGAMDFHGDRDFFTVRLREGEIIEVTARSILGDVHLYVDFEQAARHEIAFDDDSGGGSYGVDAKIVYRAPHSGTFNIVVGDDTPAPTGYALTLSRAAPGAVLTELPTPVPTPTPRPTPTAVPSPTWTSAPVDGGVAVHTTAYFDNVPGGRAPTLYVRCSNGEVDAFIAWQSLLSGTPHTYGFGDDATQNAVTLEWDESTPPFDVAFHPDPRRFLRSLLQENDLTIVAHNPVSPSPGFDYYGANFDVRGLREAMQSASWRCGY